MIGRDTRRQIVYTAIYVGLVVVIPELPLKGLVFIGGIFKGVIFGVKDSIDIDWTDFLNPFK